MKHHYIAKTQSKFLSHKKLNITDNEGIIIADFSENYSFIVQDAVQGFHWENSQSTIHPFLIYYKKDGILQNRNFCIISDHLSHDTVTFYAFQEQLISFVKFELAHLKKFFYFSDGSSAQYKNKKNFRNLGLHKEDFGIDAEWHFFATSHGKGPCDGLGGTIKRLAAKASLQRPMFNQIITSMQLFMWCQSEIKGINFVFVHSKYVVEVGNKLQQRFEGTITVKGTRDNHCFKPVSKDIMTVSRTSYSQICCQLSLTTSPIRSTIKSKAKVKCHTYVACLYNLQWWIGLVEEISHEYEDIKINFFHPHGPSPSFYWPTTKDICWIAAEDILCEISTPITATGRQYTLTHEDIESITALCANLF
jgi:hypothetical protein